MNWRNIYIAAAAAILAEIHAHGANVAITGVSQRWPWNNKVDIAYAVSGGQSRANGVYCGLVFNLTADGRTYTIEGASIGASAEDGTHTATWTAPQGIVTATASMTATLYTTNVPSGDDYMIVDLANGDVVYEGAFATQAESNARYNTAAYKTGKMAFRKVPRWSDKDTLPNSAALSSLNGYPTGHSDYNLWYEDPGINKPKQWATERNYYIGVFPVTQRQYELVYGSNPSAYKTDTANNLAAHRPVERVSWYDLRRPDGSAGDFSPTSSVPAVASNTGTFLQRLNYLTGNRFGFDLPTEVMFEIAERAGATTRYYWGDTVDTNYFSCKEWQTTYGVMPVAVGSFLPNAWGLYDTCGNMSEWCLDAYAFSSPSILPDAFSPQPQASNGNAGWRRFRGNACWNDSSSNAQFHASARNGYAATLADSARSFRVAMIAE